MELSERMRHFVISPWEAEPRNVDECDYMWGITLEQFIGEVAQLEAELAGNALMDAEAESFISGQELVPKGTLEEIERLKTYATMLEGNDYYSLKPLEIRDALRVSETLMYWIIPDEHRGTLDALVDKQSESTRIRHYGRADWKYVSHPTKQEGNE